LQLQLSVGLLFILTLELLITFFCTLILQRPRKVLRDDLGDEIKPCPRIERWLTSVILATREAEIRRTTVGGQPWQMVGKTLSEKYPT
jgi:hypothetical protein